MLEPVKRTRIYEEVVKQIIDLIKDGKLNPGEKLPTERDLAAQLNVSRTSIREALRAMEMMGYVKSQVGVGGGTFIKEVSLNNLMDPYTNFLKNNKEFLIEIIEVRIIFESEASRIAAHRLNREDEDNISKSIELMEKEIQGEKLGLEGERTFHGSIARATHNRVFIEISNMLENLLEDSRKATLSKPGIPDESLSDHREIFEAIRNHDAKNAAKLMKKHLKKAYKKVSAEL